MKSLNQDWSVEDLRDGCAVPPWPIRISCAWVLHMKFSVVKAASLALLPLQTLVCPTAVWATLPFGPLGRGAASKVKPLMVW